MYYHHIHFRHKKSVAKKYQVLPKIIVLFKKWTQVLERFFFLNCSHEVVLEIYILFFKKKQLFSTVLQKLQNMPKNFVFFLL